MPRSLVAKTYFASVAKLPDVDVERLEQFFVRIQQDPSNPGLGIQQVAGAPDSNMWSARLGPDLTAIMHVAGEEYTLLYVARSEDAHDWAMNHRVERHPETKRLQIVSLRVHTPTSSRGSSGSSDNPLDFSRFDAEYLHSLGVPREWIPSVQAIRDEEGFWEVHKHLPEETAELLYALALGEEVEPPKPASAQASSLDHDSRRRFMVVDATDELQAILARPFEEWMLYLHPSQRALVETDYNGPSKVTGSAGTGKTVVAIHRAVQLAEQGNDVLLTTYTNKLRDSIHKKLIRLTHGLNLPGQIDVETTYRFALATAREDDSKLRPINDDKLEGLLKKHYRKSIGLDLKFVIEEWEAIIDHQAIRIWQEYRDIPRTGRGTALQERQREALWRVFEPTLDEMRAKSEWTWGHLCRFAREAIESGRVKSRYDAIIVDEVQDLSTQGIRFLAALPRKGASHLMIIGDAGQRIYPGGFSLRSMGIETRGRSRRLSINYRTTHDIERAAARLRGVNVDDLEGDTEAEFATQALLRGPAPGLRGFESVDDEAAFVARGIEALVKQGVRAREIAVFARTWGKLSKFRAAVRSKGIPVLETRTEDPDQNKVVFSTMHGAKGLEFRFVFVVSCGKGYLPLRSAVKAAADSDELEALTARERNLLYVAMTRARDQVWITWTGERSPFLDAVEPVSRMVGA